MTELMWHCCDCGQDRLFQQRHAIASCPDSRSGDCPEWACTGCGAALIAGLACWPADVAWEALELPGPAAGPAPAVA